MSVGEAIEEEIKRVFLSLTPQWTTFDATYMARHEKLALYLCGAAGFVEQRFEGRAWTDDSSVTFEATVLGQWRERSGMSQLPDAVRQAVPAWRDRHVSVQIGGIIGARLTIYGEQFREEYRRSAFPEYFIPFLNENPVMGRVGLRITGSEATAPGAVPKDQATGGSAIIDVLQDMSESQKAIADALRQPEKPGDANGGHDDAMPVGVPPSVVAAHQSYQRAIFAPDAPAPKPLKGVWAWLKENDPDDYDLPEFENWCRYLRAYQHALGGAKNSSRRGRKGRNVVDPKEL